MPSRSRAMKPDARRVTRRRLMTAFAAAGGAIGLGGCDRLSRSPDWLATLDSAESLTRSVQRALLGDRGALAPEYVEADISKVFKPNGSTEPDDPDYIQARGENFANWRLSVDGL